MSADSKHSLIALTGFMGSGKSSVGQALASLLAWSFDDLDREIERAQHRTIREIFATEGEPAFRKIETASLREVLASAPRPLVLATGGGAYVRPENAELLRAEGAVVVFLNATPETLLQRCCDDADGIRPLAQDREAFLQLFEQRLPAYQTADLTVNSDNRSAESVAREIAWNLELLKM